MALTFTPDGALLATAESSRKVRLRETASGRVHHVWTNPTQISHMTCSADGRQVFGSGPDGTLSIWPLTARGVAQHLVMPAGDIRGLACGPGGPLLAVASGHTVHLAEPTTGRRSRLNAGRGDITCVALSGDASVVASGGADGSLRCWSTPGGSLLAANRQHGRVACLAVSSNGQTFASASMDGTVRMWALPGGQLLAAFHCPGAEPIVRLAFAGNGVHLSAAGANGSVVIWDLLRQQLVHRLAGPSGLISDLAFSPDGQLLAVTSASGSVCVRSLPTSLRSTSHGRPAAIASPTRATPPGHWLVDVLRKVGAVAWAP
jgi:hypothetical protein